MKTSDASDTSDTSNPADVASLTNVSSVSGCRSVVTMSANGGFVSPRRRFGFRILKRGAVRRQRAQRGQESGEQRGVVTHVRGDHLV